MDTNEITNVVNEPINGVEKKKSKVGLVLGIIAVIIVACIFYISYSNEQGKIKGERFLSLLTKDQYVVEMVKGAGEITKDGESNYSIILYDEENNPSSLDLNLVIDTGNFEGKLSSTSKDESLVLYEFVKEDKTFALNIPSVSNEFYAINNENALELAKKFGYNFDSLADEEGNKEAYEFIKTLVERYSTTLADAMGKHIKVKNNEKLVINGEEHTVELYKLELDIKTLAYIYKDVLGVLIEDEEGRAFIAAFMSQQNGTSIDVEYEALLASLNEQYMTLTFSGFIEEEDNDELIDILVYVENGKNIKTQLVAKDGTDAEISFEAISVDNKDYAKFNVTDGMREASVVYNASKNGNKFEGNITINPTEGDSSKIDIVSERLENSTRNVRKINELDYILLNEATDEELDEVCQTVFGMSLEEFAKSNMEE